MQMYIANYEYKDVINLTKKKVSVFFLLIRKKRGDNYGKEIKVNKRIDKRSV